MRTREHTTLDTLAHCCVLAIGLLLVAAEIADPGPANGGLPEPCPCRIIGP